MRKRFLDNIFIRLEYLNQNKLVDFIPIDHLKKYSDYLLEIVEYDYASIDKEISQIINDVKLLSSTLTFSRKGYANTSVAPNKNSDEDLGTIAKTHKDEGLTVREIAEKMTKSGYPIGKTKVSELLRTL